MTQARDIAVSIIVAVAENGVIGKNNDLPWRIRSEFKYFKDTTLGHPLVFGRKCFESLGKPLPGRTSIVVTRDEHYAVPNGVHVVHSFEDGVALGEKIAKENGKKEVFICGGADIYRRALDIADLFYLTEIHLQPEGDVFFPPFDRNGWQEVKREFHKAAEDEDGDYTITVLQRRGAP